MKVTELAKAGPCRCGAGARRVDRGGESAHPIYKTWAAMRHRCGPNAGRNEVRNYYERGIRVCDAWQDYDTFRDWSLANGWAAGLSIERVDNDAGYSPGNCRWATRVEQIDNRSVTLRVTAWGETKLLAEWMSDPRCVVDYHLAWDRLYRSAPAWEPERALGAPKRGRKNSRKVGAGYAPQQR